MAYIGQSIKNGTFTDLGFTGTFNSSTTAFNLGTQVGSPAQLLVSKNGVIQRPGTDYTLATGGTQISFTTAPASGDSIFIVEISGAVGGPMNTDINGAEFILDVDGDTSITADTDDQIDIKVAGTDQITIKDGAISPVTDNDVDLGTSSLEYKDGYFDGTLHCDVLDLAGTEHTSLGSNTPAFSAREASQQTINHNTVTNLTFGTEEVDTASAFASNIFTVPSGQGGKYYLECQINLYDADSNISACQLWLWKGSNSTKLSGLYDTTGGGENRSHVNNSVSVIADLSESDTVGAAVNMTTTDSGTATSYGGDSGSRIIGFKLAGA